MSNLSGRVALVTGGSSGIGAAIAKRLGQEGASVAITYASSKEKAESVARSIEAFGVRALPIRADARAVDAVREAVRTTAEKFGSLDILVNNAGIGMTGTIQDWSVDDFDMMLNINVRAVFVAAQEAARFMKPGGRIINIGSIGSEYMPIEGGSVYAATKGAIAGLTRGWARDLGPAGITVNNVQPGRIDTDMTPADGFLARRIQGSIALQRYGCPNEVAGLVALLAGPDGSFITGANLRVDGGASV
ncbi:SDR family NAD(P)-dependent oxidoreductase [Methylobacterium soli]|uniref:3-oxoacyl-ACP reductase FabG n=1 Tax=Methylobacterium soli TaxID=553447 RepID=A0A6L3SX71_9HYPH|nr:3-oxoacyl-ACP reductase family protein [Methylobacterium soli]KAB1072932.1 3-oxoacyl-ACP reductase FabG [Methylobacterium soli]GJE43489.1 Cyclic-di-GMP-binding biofilm dispersal mediator protein [Methylobacterium soli]